MRQLLLRVPDDLHRRLAERAAREGRSVNALATEVLALAASTDPASRRDRLRLRSALVGVSEPPGAHDPTASTPRQRRNAVRAMAGAGPMIDSILDDIRRST